MKAKPEWIEQWQAAPQETIAVIIHVDGDPRDYVPHLKSEGLSVTRAFRLTQTIAVTGSAQHFLDLLQSPWIVKIEPDQAITTMR
ncbi:MAG: hypothetical protein JW934_13985 [Anaerolineae bacterium]|nr:hypothetical protein [Anaerolineae bacterium]